MKRLLLTALIFTLAVSAVLASSSLPAQAGFSGNNGKIVFESDRDGNREIYTMNADGTGQTRITNNVAIDKYPRYSPDGKKIVFDSDRDGDQEIYTMNADGTDQTRITNNAAIDQEPDWSPDGNKIVFDSNRGGVTTNHEIYIMNIDGTEQTQLTNTPQYDVYPAWSPDGTKIAFRSNRTGLFDVWLMNADGSSQTKLTDGSIYTFSPPAWSPDGTKIVYDTVIDNFPSGDLELHRINVDGTGDIRLTTNPAIDWHPAWSPDATKIAFTTNRDGNSEIYTMNPDGSGQTRITTNSGSDTFLSWQRPVGTTTTDSSGHETITISSSESYPVLDLTVKTNETLVLDGNVCDVVVESGGTLKGTGTACTITVEPGGTINPGHSPGCLNSGNLSLSGIYTAELAGTTPCSGYDQLQVTGTVAVGGTLNISLLNNFSPTQASIFTLIDNDSTDPVTGTFASLAEGATVTIGSNRFTISYTGGTGNDVTLTTLASLPGLPVAGSAPVSTALNMSLFLLARR